MLIKNLNFSLICISLLFCLSACGQSEIENPAIEIPPKENPMQIVSPPDADCVIAYFQQCPESPDGKKVVFTIFHEPDTMEVAVKNLETNELTSVAKIGGQLRHTGAHPIWMDNETLIYGSRIEYKIYCHNLQSGKIISFPGGSISDYSSKNNALLFDNARNFNDTIGIFVYDFNTNSRKCIISVDDVKHLAREMKTENPPEIWSLGHPYWSPSGDKINFQIKSASINKSTANDDFTLYADKNGENIKFIGKKPMHVQWWDNNSVYGHDWQDKKDFHMKRYNLEGEVVEELSGHGCHGAVSPNRQWIVTETWYGSDPVKVMLYERGDMQPTKLLHTQPKVINGIDFWEVRSHIHPAFSRDGKKVYFNAQGEDGKSRVWCYDLSDIVN